MCFRFMARLGGEGRGGGGKDYGSVLVRFGEKPVVPSYRSKGNFFSPIDDMEVESQPDYLAGFRSQPVEEKEVVVVYWEILN